MPTNRTFKITIKCEGDAFRPNDRIELRRIIRDEILIQMESITSGNRLAGNIVDRTGNVCGSWCYNPHDKEDQAEKPLEIDDLRSLVEWVNAQPEAVWYPNDGSRWRRLDDATALWKMSKDPSYQHLDIWELVEAYESRK